MSILGFVSRRPLVTLGAAAGLWWLWPGASAPSAPNAPNAPAQPQAAVLADGFAALAGGDRITLFDEAARRRGELAVDDAPLLARVVGVGGHVGLVWRDGKRVAVAVVGEDGQLEQTTKFGKRVDSMCRGVATNEHRFGVAWLESDGSVWFVHGPTAPRGAGEAAGPALEAIDATAEAPFAEPPKPDVCMIASAHDKLALLYTEGSRTTLVLCGKSCTAPRRVDLPKRNEVLGFGCTRGGCAIATRTESGATLATWVTPQGRAQWTKPLPHASERTRVSLAGTGAQVAIAYETANEPVVVTASAAGAIATVWQGQSDAVPGLVHASGRLLVARIVDGELTGSVVRVP